MKNPALALLAIAIAVPLSALAQESGGKSGLTLSDMTCDESSPGRATNTYFLSFTAAGVTLVMPPKLLFATPMTRVKTQWTGVWKTTPAGLLAEANGQSFSSTEPDVVQAIAEHHMNDWHDPWVRNVVQFPPGQKGSALKGTRTWQPSVTGQTFTFPIECQSAVR